MQSNLIFLHHLPHPVVFSLRHFCVNLLSVSPYNLHLLFCCVLYIFALTLLVLVALFGLLSEVIQFFSLSYPFLAMSKIYCVRFRFFFSLKISINIFPFLFSGYFCSVDVCVVWIDSGYCNQYSPAFLMQSFSRYIDGSTLSTIQAGHLPFFSWHIV